MSASVGDCERAADTHHLFVLELDAALSVQDLVPDGPRDAVSRHDDLCGRETRVLVSVEAAWFQEIAVLVRDRRKTLTTQ